MTGDQRPNARALLFINLAHFIDHYFMLIFPTAVLLLTHAWGLSYAEALALGTPAFVMFAAATMPSGWLGDRFGGVVMLRLFLFGMGGSAIMAGLAQGPASLMVAMGLLGTFAAIYHPVATAMIVNLAQEPGRELGLNGVYGNLGVALAAAITGGLAAWLGWRAAFIVPGLASLVVGLLYLRASGDRGEGAGRPVVRADPAFGRSEQLRVFAVVGTTALMGGLVFAAVTIALPKLFEERLDVAVWGIAGVGAVTTAVLFAASFTQLFTGRMVDRLGPKPILLTAAGLQVPLLLALGTLPGIVVVPLAIPLMLVVFGAIPVSSWLLGHYVSKAWRSRAYGMQYMLALGVNALIIPLIAGLYRQSGDSTALFLLLAGAASMVFAASFLLPGGKPGAARRPVMETSAAAS
ncbi:MAG: MFS transporter [Geminicoccaceae bacterium]|nr:MFS transporter [Geminicoccaceae bacterium]